MALTDCIMPKQAELLKKAFRSGEISIQKMHNATSRERVAMFEKYVGTSAKDVVSRFEKAFLVPRQKQALREAVYKTLGITPLYDGLTIEESQRMSNEINIRDLRNMSSDDRLSLFMKYVNPDMADKLNELYKDLHKSGNLQHWEKRAFGTEKIFKDKKLKGALAKIEALDDLGALNPEQTEDFMETLVEDVLGVGLTIEESRKLSELVNSERDAYDKLMNATDGQLTYKNKDLVLDFLLKVRALEDYTQTLMPMTPSKIVNMVFGIMRAFILASHRILRNSFMYQLVPFVERALVKRIVSGNMTDEDLKSNFFEKMQSKLSGIKPNKDTREFINGQVAMAMEIYHKTGFDLSRMENLAEGQYFFGEKVSNVAVKPWNEAETAEEKIASIVGAVSKVSNLAPKWMAGGTDTLFANWGRADTATMLSREIAHMEEKKGVLPEGMTRTERETQLLMDSYSFQPKDPKAKFIREAGILDAHRMNNTQPDALADKVIQLRRMMNLGGLDFGMVIIPFAKIATTTISEGLQTATGVGILKGLWKIGTAVQKENARDRAVLMYQGINDLIRYLTFTGMVMLIAGLLDDDDYIGEYSTLTQKEYALARSKGANPYSIRIAGKWIPLKYLPILNVPLASIMEARKARSMGFDYASGYIKGIFSHFSQIAGIKEIWDFKKKTERVTKSKDIDATADALGFEGRGIADWIKVRVIPSVISYDLYNALFPPKTKYDFLGRNIEGQDYMGFRDDKANDIVIEFDRLLRAGYAPTISDPKGEYDAEELSELKRDYAREVGYIIDSERYTRLSDKDKKDYLDKIRTKTILNPAKRIRKSEEKEK